MSAALRRARRPGWDGFTLIEAAIAMGIISIIIASVGYGAGLAGRSVRAEKREFRRADLLATKLNQLDATPFSQVVAGADTIVAGKDTYYRGWTTARFDGNGDGQPDAGLLLVTVWVDTDTCQTLRCDLR